MDTCTQTPRETIEGCMYCPCGYLILSGWLMPETMVMIVSAFNVKFYPDCQG